MKKILIFISLIFILSSCFDWKNIEDNSWNSVQTKYNWTDFSMTIPAKWELLKNTWEILPKPSSWEIIFDAVSSIKNDGFYRNILVLKQDIEETNFSSLDFIIWNYLWTKNDYFYMKKLKEENVKIDSKNTKIYSFEAKYSEDTPILKFLQTWVICDKKGYIITIALEKSNKNIDRYEGLLGSFKCSPLSVSPSKGEK